MIRTIIKCNFYINNVISCQNTRKHCALNTVINCWNIFFRNCTTNNFVNKFIAFARIWFNFNLNVAVLSTTAGLSCIFFFNICIFTNSFFICNLRFTNICFHFEFTQKSIDYNFKVKLSHSRNNSLACFFIGISFKCWVFFSKFCKSKAHFFLTGFCFWLNCNTDNRIREFHRFKNYRMFFIAKRITRCGIFKSYRSSNVSCINFFYILPVVRMHLKNTPKSFFIIFR